MPGCLRGVAHDCRGCWTWAGDSCIHMQVVGLHCICGCRAISHAPDERSTIASSDQRSLETHKIEASQTNTHINTNTLKRSTIRRSVQRTPYNTTHTHTPAPRTHKHKHAPIQTNMKTNKQTNKQANRQKCKHARERANAQHRQVIKPRFNTQSGITRHALWQ